MHDHRCCGPGTVPTGSRSLEEACWGADRMRPSVRRSRAGLPPPTLACTWIATGRSCSGSASRSPNQRPIRLTSLPGAAASSLPAEAFQRDPTEIRRRSDADPTAHPRHPPSRANATPRLTVRIGGVPRPDAGNRTWPPGDPDLLLEVASPGALENAALQFGEAGPPRSANRGIGWLGERATALGSPQGGSRLVTGSTATFELAVLSSACQPASADPMLTNPPSVQGHSPGGSEIRVADGRVSPRRPDEEPPRPVTGEAVPGQATRSSGGPSSRRHGL